MREVDNEGIPLKKELSPKTEIKNVNSFKAVERVIRYEIKRQTKLWEMGTPPSVLTTRGWNDARGITEEQRIKEDSADYRYFPEPDIPPMELTAMTEEIRRRLPELPRARRRRFVDEYGFQMVTARQIVEDPDLADFTEQSMSELGAWLQSRPDVTPEGMEAARRKLTKLFSGWLLNKLMGVLIERKIGIKTMKINPENFAEFITLLADGKLNGPNGLKVLGRMLDDGSDPSHIVDDLGATRMDDADALLSVIETVIENNGDEAQRFREGEKKLMQFFVGQVMKETRGNADPQMTAKLIKQSLG